MGIISGVHEKIAAAFTINRGLPRYLEDVVTGRRRVRVVVLGSRNCGKTVLLTSLACHLLNHSSRDFNLDGWDVFRDEDYRPPKKRDGDPATFPYAEYREGFAKAIPEFPQKTNEEISVMRLPLIFRKEGFRDRKILLELMDLPGERVADLVMAQRDYRGWCDWMQQNLAGEYNSVRSYRDYLERIETAEGSDALFAEYKRYLAGEYRQYSPWIVPSIVKLTATTGTDFLEEIEGRPLGLDAESQFVPLPMEAFDSHHALNRYVKGFERAYRKYRARIVDPISGWLSEADHLVYLVNVLGILKEGVVSYDAEQAFGSAVIGMFRRRRTRTVLGPVVDYLSGLVKTKIKDAYLVATKADIARGDEGRDAMCNLAEQLLGKAVRGLGLGKSGFAICACSAVNTIRLLADEADSVKARQQVESVDETEYKQLDVPEEWPDGAKWAGEIESGRYWFEDTFPLFDARRNAVPGQIGLDDLTKSILADVL